MVDQRLDPEYHIKSALGNANLKADLLSILAKLGLPLRGVFVPDQNTAVKKDDVYISGLKWWRANQDMTANAAPSGGNWSLLFDGELAKINPAIAEFLTTGILLHKEVFVDDTLHIRSGSPVNPYKTYRWAALATSLYLDGIDADGFSTRLLEIENGGRLVVNGANRSYALGKRVGNGKVALGTDANDLPVWIDTEKGTSTPFALGDSASTPAASVLPFGPFTATGDPAQQFGPLPLVAQSLRAVMALDAELPDDDPDKTRAIFSGLCTLSSDGLYFSLNADILDAGDLIEGECFGVASTGGGTTPPDPSARLYTVNEYCTAAYCE